MKIILSTIAITLLLLVGVGTPVAQGAKNQATNFPAFMAASEIKGTHVKNLQGEDLGEIEEVLVDPETGQVKFAVLEVGGFLGLGSTKVAVPWSAFQLTQEGNKPRWVLDADKQRLKNAPKVEGKNYQRLYTKSESEPILVYWKVTTIETR
jgi:sporulation protein YlmC with PRC-barrel domain